MVAPGSLSNVELQRRFTAAYNEREIEAMLALCDPDIEWISTFAAVGGAVYRGHDGVRKYRRDMEEAWGEEISWAPEAYFDLGEHTLGFGVWHGRGRQSGADVAMPAAVVATWRNGLMIRVKGYVDREDALRDLGVSGDELESIAP